MEVGFSDPRELRPIVIRAKKQEQLIVLGHTEKYELNKQNISFVPPNNISICLNISAREYSTATEYFKKEIQKKLSSGNEIEFSKDKNKELYNYFENVQTSLIFSYIAVEAFANLTIPDDYELEQINNKKVKEVWNKESIERWKTTTEKIGSIVPDILEVESPKNLKIWSDFKKLESIRNEIIHQKTAQNKLNVSSTYLHEFFSNKIFEYISAGPLLIEYFCSKSKSNYPYFPISYGSQEIKPLEFEDFEKHFKLVDETKKNKNNCV